MMEHALMPHAICLLVERHILQMIEISHAVHWVSYRMIALAFTLWVFGYIRVLEKPQLAGLLMLTAVFVFTCGDTHYWAWLTLWDGGHWYWYQAIWGLISAAISIATLVVAWTQAQWSKRSPPHHWSRYSFYIMAVLIAYQYSWIADARLEWAARYGS